MPVYVEPMGYTYIHIYIYIYMYVCMYVCLFVYVRIGEFKEVSVFVCRRTKVRRESCFEAREP